MAQDPDLVARLEERIADLERSVERLAAGHFESITLTRGLYLRTPDGDLKGALLLLEEGAALAFWGQEKVTFSIDGSTPSITMNDAAGRARLQMKLNDDGQPLVALKDEEETPRLSVSALADTPRVMLNDSQGRLRMAMSLQPSAHLHIYDEDKRVRTNISLEDEGPMICSLDAAGRVTGAL